MKFSISRTERHYKRRATALEMEVQALRDKNATLRRNAINDTNEMANLQAELKRVTNIQLQQVIFVWADGRRQDMNVYR